MIDLPILAAHLLPGGEIASDLVSRTSDAMRVQSVLTLSLAPAFLLVGIGSISNVMMARLTWVANRIERLEARYEERPDEKPTDEYAWLKRRRGLAQRAVMFSIAAAMLISVLIAVLFVSAFVTFRIGTLIAVLWVATMVLLIAGLSFFFRETRIAALGPPSRRSRRD